MSFCSEKCDAMVRRYGILRRHITLASASGCLGLLMPLITFAGNTPSAPTNVMIDGNPASVFTSIVGAAAGSLSGVQLGDLSTTFSSVVYAPTLPQASGPNDIVGFAIQNPNNAAVAGRYITFGQVFAKGAVQASQPFVAQLVGGGLVPVQVDSLAQWPDGSVKFAALSLETPALAAGTRAEFMLQRGSTSTEQPALNVAAVPFSLSVTLKFSAPTGGSQTIDLRQALLNSLSSDPSIWLSGPLATQARVDVPVNQTLHLIADITVYKDGTVSADVQFNNDLAKVVNNPPGGVVAPLSYTAQIVLNGKKWAYEIQSQYQYQDWHAVISSAGGAFLNVQHDPLYIEKTGAVLPFDVSTGVSAATMNGLDALVESGSFGDPLNNNGLDQRMGDTGGRPDIGYTTLANAAWLITQNPVAAAVGLMQGDASGAIPWNMKLANNHWLNVADYPNVWPDPRSGQWGLSAIANDAPTLTGNQAYSGWELSLEHIPNLSYIPYLMTASRWYLDRLNAEAAFAVTGDWPNVRNIDGYNDLLMNTGGPGGEAIRAAAWGMREIIEAAFIDKTNSWSASYFQKVEADNWTWAEQQEPGLSQSAGQVAGFWIPPTTPYILCSSSASGCAIGSTANPPTWLATATWQQDFLSGIILQAALMGDAKASQIAQWQRNWVVGRFSGNGMNPHDGCNYMIPVAAYPKNNSGPIYFTSWSQVESAEVASGQTNGSGWGNSGGYYCQLARSVLGAWLTLDPTDSGAQAAFNWISNAGAPYVDYDSRPGDANSLLDDPNFDVAPLP